MCTKLRFIAGDTISKNDQRVSQFSTQFYAEKKTKKMKKFEGWKILKQKLKKLFFHYFFSQEKTFTPHL